MNGTCAKCGGELRDGIVTAVGLIGGAIDRHNKSRVIFVQKGSPTASNPVKALVQSLKDDPGDVAFRLSASRCSCCGAVEFSANEEIRI